MISSVIRALCVCFFALVTACGERVDLSEWVQVCPAQQFCFYQPSALKQLPQQSIDSVAGLYQSESLQLVYDLGFYSSSFSGLDNPDVEVMVIDGRPGKVLVDGNIIALWVPEVRRRIHFSMSLQFSHGLDVALARKIFSSIEFSLSE